jgi:hypothetical protein
MAVRIHRERRVFGPVDLRGHTDFGRADLEIFGVNHFRPSFTAHVYVNAPAAAELEPTLDSYAGSFSIFGHQRCSGGEGHCEVHQQLRRFDDRPSHPLTRAFKRVVITDALRRALQAGTTEVTITFDVVAPADAAPGDEPLLEFQGLQIASFDD